ncbi:L-aminoadipate-semialdehyde dehydrogenase-phosphopantetheinyl transferase-like [Iris pallida]|uniref:holo-[acyl-carrier-protein] synthase n=1 Tax=Iris pallida TaxID=29817 RepID=A0AAX6DG48_IRIPA|nr:L-aminoadipate-semialdehyde dehydrogenase-phosphopantetheinyl transferase-like [Iris pallida]
MEDGGVRRWVVDISKWNPSEDEFCSYLSVLPPHEHPTITRFIKCEDRKRALVSRLLQYSLVHEVFGIPFERIIINRTIEGKPYLQNTKSLAFPNFNFSASHHGDYVGIASEPVCLVGLDIISNSIPTQETALEFINNFSSYFTALEWKNITEAENSDEALAAFYRCWSLKEAFVKALGTGLGYGLQRLEFRHTNWTDISVFIDGEESRDWRFSLFEIDDRHWASIAQGHPKTAVQSFKSTLLKADFEREHHLDPFLLPDAGGFILQSVDQLVAVSKQEKLGRLAP